MPPCAYGRFVSSSALQGSSLAGTCVCRSLTSALHRSSIEPQRLQHPVYKIVADRTLGNMWIATPALLISNARRSSISKISFLMGPKLFPISRSSIFWHGKIADRQNGFSQARVESASFPAVDCAPAAGGNGVRPLRISVAQAYPARPRGWDQHMPCIRPLRRPGSELSKGLFAAWPVGCI